MYFCFGIDSVACKCISEGQEQTDVVTQKNIVMQQGLAALAGLEKYHNSDQYTVEHQPFFLDTTIPKAVSTIRCACVCV